MMVFTFYYWCLFIIVLVIVLMPTLIYLIQLNEDGVKAGKTSYLAFLSCALSGLLPIVGSMVMSVSTLTFIWKATLGFVCLVTFVSFFRYARYNRHFFASFLLTIGLALAPFVYYSELVPTSNSRIAAYFDDHFPWVLLSLWLPLFLFGILMGYILVPRGRVNSNSHIGAFSSDRRMLDRSIENMAKNLEAQNLALKSQVKNLNDAINTLQLQSLVAKYPHSDNKSDGKIGTMLAQLRDDIAILKSHANQYEVTEIKEDQEVLVRELSHFLATPLATIDASCKALQNIPLKGRDQAKLADNFERILASVKMCNGIIGTYKEIFVGGKIEDSQRLPDMIKSAFEIYQRRENKQLKINIKVGDRHQNLSNYCVLSIILPLLSNAVTAAKANTSIDVIENGGSISVANSFQGNIDLSNFEIEGYSSKPDHRGMGLYTVRHLLARRKLGGLNYGIKDNRIIFEVLINNRENEQQTN